MDWGNPPGSRASVSVSRPPGSSRCPPGMSRALGLWPLPFGGHLLSDVSSRKPLHTPWTHPRHHLVFCWRQSCFQQIEGNLPALLRSCSACLCSQQGALALSVRDIHFAFSQEMWRVGSGPPTFSMEDFSKAVVGNGLYT